MNQENGQMQRFWESNGFHLGTTSRTSSLSSGDVVLRNEECSAGGPDCIETEEAAAEMGEQLHEMVSGFAKRLAAEVRGDGKYYVSDVFACNDPERAEHMARQLARRAADFRRGFVGISIHNDHVHAIHDCPFSNRSCRCAFKQFPEAKEDIRRLLRSPRLIQTFQTSDWYNIIQYFSSEGRRFTYFKINGTDQAIPIKISAISNALLPSGDGQEPQSSVADCCDSSEHPIKRKRETSSESDEYGRRRSRRNPAITGGRFGVGGTASIVLKYLEKYAVCPLTEVVFCKDYLEDPLVCLKRTNDKDVQSAIDCRAACLNRWCRDDYVSYYNDVNVVKLWSARTEELFDVHYYDYDTSYELCKQLLLFQFRNDIENVRKFCLQLQDIIDMRTPKLNCMVVISPPSAGKNFFFDPVRDYFLNAGQMTNPNKYNTFAYQDCYNKRLIIWNEPNYESRETENLKMFFAGDNISVNVKCKPQAHVKRTPVIVLSNHKPNFLGSPAFKDRCISYRWQSAPFLKDHRKKMRPDAVVDFVYSFIQ